jgi:hypothetical protein
MVQSQLVLWFVGPVGEGTRVNKKRLSYFVTVHWLVGLVKSEGEIEMRLLVHWLVGWLKRGDLNVPGGDLR